jgi:hypothetical protein
MYVGCTYVRYCLVDICMFGEHMLCTVWCLYVCIVDICQVLSCGHMYVGWTYVRYCLVDICM